MPEAAVAEPESKTIDASQLFDGRVVEAMPEVNEAAVKAEESKPVDGVAPAVEPVAPAAAPAAPIKPAVKAAPSKPAAVDADGKPFDPLIHEATPDGKPVMRADGVTLKKRRTPLKEYKTTSHVGGVDDPVAPAAEQPAADPAASPAMQLAGAATCAGVQLMLMRVALGNKIGQSEAEQEQLTTAWVAVFQHYGMGAMHPIVGLAMVSGGIVVAAMHHEETQTRLQKLMQWGREKMAVLWVRITGKKRRQQQPEQQQEQPEKEKQEAHA